MSEASPSETRDPLTRHRALAGRFEQDAAAQDRRVGLLSLVQLGLFGGAVVLGGSGLFAGSIQTFAGGAGLFVVFLLVRVYQSRVMAVRDAALTRREVHERHLKRLMGSWRELAQTDQIIPDFHPYAGDLDIVGEGSLMQRIDTTHTTAGSHAARGWAGRCGCAGSRSAGFPR